MSHSRLFVIAAAATLSAFASPTFLLNGTSTAHIIDDGNFAGTLDAWWIGNGANQVFEQSYLYRLEGSGAAGYVGTLGPPVISQPTPDIVSYLFTAPGQFDILIRYFLTGDTVHADIAESVRVRNLGTSPLHFELFEYDDFDLGGTGAGDSLARTHPGQMDQWEGGTSVTVGATSVPDHFEMGLYPSVIGNMLAAGFANLDDIDDTVLNGDCTFAFQWVWDIGPNNEEFISKDKILVVPEPATMLVLGGLAALALRRRKG